MDAAVDFRQLFLGKKSAGGEEAGPDGKVPLGLFVAAGEAMGAIIVALPQRSSVMRPIPCDELDAEAGLVPCQNCAVKICQQLVPFPETLSFQRWGLFHQGHILPRSLDDFPDLVKDSLLPGGVFLKITETPAAVDPAQRLPVMRNVDVSGL
jgi:hypothetical protein